MLLGDSGDLHLAEINHPPDTTLEERVERLKVLLDDEVEALDSDFDASSFFAVLVPIGLSLELPSLALVPASLSLPFRFASLASLSLLLEAGLTALAFFAFFTNLFLLFFLD
eukprot:CAMPEP_0195037128 /NCGR_PEP_ID=MMETSP0326_2-20130528/74199_1 /TAXON_ID=2866 ORGANISM="Crypthecodinium cohnii, Strain Seligo" /NCGR_SAMPLE_ID=MMETSP0326_2 /ASSEMBLY_ACC=CAM_ASM_000348 /LENGTH=111 /DNA_ID=CAMNT_0040062977 /DNA_START=61 /DNA_END=395 /DNA_ORIENTATION=+